MMQNLRRGGWATWVLLVVALGVAAAPILTYPLGRDQGEFATIAAVILRGGVPYVDVWNPKPPAIFYVYAGLVSVFGPFAWTVRVLDLLLLPLMGAALYGIGRRLRGPGLGLWAVLLYGVFYFTESFWTLSQNDGTAAVPMALAVWAALALLDTPPGAYPRRRVLLAGASGALCATALWFKYPYGLFVAGLGVGYLLARRRWLWLELGAFAGGGLVVGLGGMALLWAGGALTAWVESARVTAGYTAQGYDWGVFRADMARYWGFRWAQWGPLWVLAGVGLLLRIGFNRLRTGQKPIETDKQLVTDGDRWSIIIIWLVSTAAAMLVQAKGYDYHWLPMLPALALLGAWTIEQGMAFINSSEFLPRWAPITIQTLLILVSFVYLTVQTWGMAWPYLSGRQPQLTYHTQFIGGQFTAEDTALAVDYLRTHTTPGETLFVWGFRPELYYLTQTRPATRFIFQFPLVATWYPPEWREQVPQTLWQTLPRYVVVARGDFMPWVTGRDADSNMLLQEYTELNNWLIFNYEQATEAGSFLIWERKPPA